MWGQKCAWDWVAIYLLHAVVQEAQSLSGQPARSPTHVLSFLFTIGKKTIQLKIKGLSKNVFGIS